MRPQINAIDHIHVYVKSWEQAEPWYEKTLGFTRAEGFSSWAVEGGPLTLENEQGNVHLALFERSEHTGSSAIAFGADGEQFLAWKEHLEALGLELRISDHTLAFSLYFNDPDSNMHEITTYEHELVRERLATDSDGRDES